MAENSALYAPEKAILIQSFPTGLDPRMYAIRKFVAKEAKAPPVWASASTSANIAEENVSFAIPSPAALFLYAAQRAYFRLHDIDLSKVVKRTKDSLTVEENLRQLYDAFEHLSTNIIFSYSAIEAYANLLIPDGYSFTVNRSDKRCTETYSKDQIERFISLDVKLSQVLPEITGVTFNKGTALWNEFTGLQNLRDRLIHVKSVDVGVRGGNEEAIWSLLLQRRNMDASSTAHRVMKCFPQKNDDFTPVAAGRNAWLHNYPFFRRQDPAK